MHSYSKLASNMDHRNFVLFLRVKNFHNVLCIQSCRLSASDCSSRYAKQEIGLVAFQSTWLAIALTIGTIDL